MLQDFLDRTKLYYSRLRRGRTVNINDRDMKSAAIELAADYFTNLRPSLCRSLNDEHLPCDQRWQDLVRLAQKNSPRKTYVATLSNILKDIQELNVRLITKDRSKQARTQSDLTPAEVRLLKTLEDLLPSAAASYQQGINDLVDAGRVSFRGTASEFRESLREVLDHLAPDSEVMKQVGFKLEEGQNRPSMRQKAHFVLKSRGRSKTQFTTTEKSIEIVEGLIADMVRAVYNRASLATHVETTRVEVVRLKQYVDTVLYDLLEISGNGIVPDAKRMYPSCV